MRQTQAIPRERIPPPLGAILSIVPGLGQIVSGYVTRGILLLFSIPSLYAIGYWRVVNEEVEASVIPPSLQTSDLNNAQQQVVVYALLAFALLTIAYVWNIYDGWVCAGGKPSPARMAGVFISIATLILGAHVTELEIGKAISEVGDVQPRLAQIAWPWDPWDERVLTREVEQLDGTAVWETPCSDEDPAQPEPDGDTAVLTISPMCGEPAGNRMPDGSREPGTIVSIQGEGFRPGEAAEVVINPQSISEFRLVEEGERVQLIPDENGAISAEFMMPNINIPSTAVGSTPIRIIVRQSEATGTLRVNEDLRLAGEAMIETVFLALMATAAGLVLAVPVSFIAARNLMMISPVTVVIYYVVRLILNIVRSIEPLVWALIAIIWVGPGPFAGTIALTLHTIAALGKLYSEAIENIDSGPIEALQATGANRLQTIIYAVVPQVVPPFVSFTIYRWDINVRMSTIIGAVGGGGIGFILIQWIRLARYDSVGVAVWLIAIVVTVLDYASARIREAYV